jgi:hypothetical protein
MQQNVSSYLSDFTLILPVQPERFGLFLVETPVQGNFPGSDLRLTASNPAFSILCFAGAGDGPIEWLLEPPFENPLLRRKPSY